MFSSVLAPVIPRIPLLFKTIIMIIIIVVVIQSARYRCFLSVFGE
jgi:hypothetical protein